MTCWSLRASKYLIIVYSLIIHYKRKQAPTEFQISLHRAKMALKHLIIFFTLLSILAISSFADTESSTTTTTTDSGLVLNFYKDSCPQAEDIIREQVGLLYKRHKNTAFSWLRNIFHDCAVEVHIYSLSYYFCLSQNKCLLLWITILLIIKVYVLSYNYIITTEPGHNLTKCIYGIYT